MISLTVCFKHPILPIRGLVMLRPILFTLGCSVLLGGAVQRSFAAEEEPLPQPVEEAAPPAVDEAPPAVSEEAGAQWQEVQDLVQVEGAMRLAEAENLYLEARSLYQRAYFVEAKDLVDRALTAFPAHTGAQELRENILGILSLRSDRLRMMARWMGSLGEVAVQEQAVRLAGLLDQGDKAMEARDYLGAARLYDRVAIGIRTFPYRFDWGNLPDVVQSKIFGAQSEARRDDLIRLDGARRAASVRAEEERQREEALLRAKVDAILSRAHRHFLRGDFRRAAIEAWNAYELDRRREDARSLYLEARRLGHVQFDDYLAQEQPERIDRVFENLHQALIPQTDLMVYPDNWFQINLRKPEEIGERQEEGWQRELRNRLEQEVEFIWEDTMLEDAIEFLRQTTGVNFVVSPDVYAAGGPPPITLSGRMRLRTVLQWISQITRLEYTLRSQAVFISSDLAESDTVLRLYDVNDLLSPVVDFEGPELAWSAVGGGGGAGGGFDLFGGGFGAADPAGLEIDQIQALIEESIAPDTWQNPGVAIDIRQGGTLFINQSPEIHDLVQELLRSLRSQASLQVNTRIRLLDLRKAFIEEIGVEYRNLDLITNGFPGFTRGGNSWFTSGNLTQAMPENTVLTPFNTTNAGLRLNAAFNEAQVNAVFEAMQQERDAIILNAPELTSFSGQRANAQFIRQIAYISDYDVDGGVLNPVISVLNVGDIIDVRPLVSADRKYVTLEVRPTSVILQDVYEERIATVTTLADAAVPLSYPIDLPNVEVRTLRTTVMLPDKGSLMLGGYVRGLRQRTHSGIPFLSHIPFLGRLFSKNGIYDENRHLMFLVTVTIIDVDELENLQ